MLILFNNLHKGVPWKWSAWRWGWESQGSGWFTALWPFAQNYPAVQLERGSQSFNTQKMLQLSNRHNCFSTEMPLSFLPCANERRSHLLILKNRRQLKETIQLAVTIKPVWKSDYRRTGAGEDPSKPGGKGGGGDVVPGATPSSSGWTSRPCLAASSREGWNPSLNLS